MPLPIRTLHFEQVFFYFRHLSKITPLVIEYLILSANFYFIRLIDKQVIILCASIEHAIAIC